MTERLLEYEHDGVVLEGLLAIDDEVSGQRPGVVIAHAWGGRGEFEEKTARDLARRGYVGFWLRFSVESRDLAESGRICCFCPTFSGVHSP